MAVCPNCEAEYLSHVRVCMDCDVELVDSLPLKEDLVEEPLDSNTTFETVYEDSNSLNARMAMGLLEANGFRPKMLGAHEANYPPTGPFKIQVPTQMAAEAKELIDAYYNSNLTDFEAYNQE